MSELEKMVLETLSFYRPMAIESLILSLDKDIVDSMPDLDMEDLHVVLKDLRKQKKVFLIKKDSKTYYQRRFPPISLWRRLRSLISK